MIASPNILRLQFTRNTSDEAVVRTISCARWLVMGALLAVLPVTAAEFRNLGFEEYTPLYPEDPDWSGPFLASQAIPGWRWGCDGVLVDEWMHYNIMAAPDHIEFAVVSSNYTRTASLQPEWSGGVPASFGQYTLNASVATSFAINSITNLCLGQNGTIPSNAQTLSFATWSPGGVGLMQLNFGTNILALRNAGVTADGEIWTADISAFAGQTDELKFTFTQDTQLQFFFLDNLSFSAVPEPTTLAIFMSGALVLLIRGGRRWH
jgi:hypothetical protein